MIPSTSRSIARPGPSSSELPPVACPRSWATVFIIEHIGSTAVPHLAAKDCIDVLIVAPSTDHMVSSVPLIESSRYEFRPQAFPADPPHFFFRRVRNGLRTQHLHMLSAGNPQINAYLALRRLLR